MPLTAIYGKTKEKIDITSLVDPKIEIPDIHDLFCPFCEQQMSLKAGRERIAHFSHKVKCSCSYERHGESPAHIEGKRMVVECLRRKYPNSNVKIEVEAKIDAIKRIADVLVTFPSGMREVYEVQISSISPLDVEKRSLAYESEEIAPYWIFSESALTAQNKTMCKSNHWNIALLLAHQKDDKDVENDPTEDDW